MSIHSKSESRARTAISSLSLPTYFPLLVVIVGILALVVSQFVPFLGMLFALLAPTIVLVGVTLALAQLIVPRSRTLLRALVFPFLFVLAGANTRIPAYITDILEHQDRTDIRRTLSVPLGSAIQLSAEHSSLSARTYPYRSAMPICADDLCMWQAGFGPALIGDSYYYWSESLATSLFRTGLTIAGASIKAPRLEVQSQVNDYVQVVSFRLFDEASDLVASGIRHYRFGFPLEASDYPIGSRTKGQRAPRSVRYAIDYLLHGNVVTAFLSRSSEPYPVERFLKSATAPLPMPSPAHRTVSVTPIVEVDEEVNETADWKTRIEDSKRSRACEHLLDPFIGEWSSRPTYSTVEEHRKNMSWIGSIDYVGLRRFAKDQGNGTIIDIKQKSVLCDGQSAYVVGLSNDRITYNIDKYDKGGALTYSLSLFLPSASNGFAGVVSESTLREQDGILRAEYLDVRQEGDLIRIARKRSLAIPLLGHE
jgi:hypothetical protein